MSFVRRASFLRRAGTSGKQCEQGGTGGFDFADHHVVEQAGKAQQTNDTVFFLTE